MDRISTRLPTVVAGDQLDRALLEIDIAIALVLAGVAVTITLSCLEGAEAAAFTGAVWAQSAGVAFRLLREPALPIGLVIGPRVRPLPIAALVEMES
jgi:hypothetical protein